MMKVKPSAEAATEQSLGKCEMEEVIVFTDDMKMAS